jgi:predicted Ser/Thr protein kinase
MHTPPERDPNRPPDEPQPGSSGRANTPNKATTLNLKNSSLVRLTAVSATPDLLAEDGPNNTDDFPTVITASPNELQVPALTPGSRLGNFELMEAIGAGGMATVIKARDVDLGRIVALKILPPATARDSEAVTRFKLEARAAAKLDHENIARVYFCGEDRNLHFIAFEFVEGENLRQRIDRAGRLSATDAIHYLLQLSSGLAHAADRGVIHRDIKPSNILITPDGKAKIVDMGLARHLDGHSVNGGVTQSGVTLGTFDYISPEQALDPRRADIRSDIYSLGCAFYHALTGRPPVPEGTAAKKLYAHENESPTDPRDLNPAVPDGLAMVLAKMMAKKPDYRYQSPADLATDLTMLLGPDAVVKSGVVPFPQPSSQFAAPHAPVPPRLTLAWLFTFAVLAVAAILYVSLAGPTPNASVAPWQEPPPQKGDPPAPPVGNGNATNPEVRTGRVADARGLAESLVKQGGKALVQLRPGAVYDLTTLNDGILVTGKEVVIEPEPFPADRTDGVRPVLRLAASPPAEKGTRPGTITFRDVGRVTLRGVEVQIVDRLALDEQPDDDPVGVLFENVGRAEVENCLIRTTPESRRNRIVGLAVGYDTARPTTFVLKNSLVDIGLQGVGLRLLEGTDATVSEVGFGPHQSAVVWVGDEDDPPPSPPKEPALRFASCTFMFDRGGAAITADPRATCPVSLAACVFADTSVPDEKFMMPGMDMKGTLPVVLRSEQTLDAFHLLTADGQPANAYFRVTAPPSDPRPIQLANPPWAVADPRPLLTTANPWSAFVLNLNEKRLRASGPPHVLGLRMHQADGSKPIYGGGWPPGRPALPVTPKAGQRVVHPDATPEDAESRVYPTVAKAFEDLKPGETLLVAQNGRVPVSLLAEKTLRATIAPFDGFTPILVASEDTVRRPDASLFPLVDGELTFSGVHVQLGGRAAVVTMAGGTTCTFKNCTVTLEEKDDDAVSVVVLSEPTREMKVGASDPALPKLRMENTFVRGRGKGVTVRSPRPFDWTVENCAFALDGAVLSADAALRDVSMSRAAVRWRNVTAATTGHLMELRGGAGRVLGLDVTCERSLLASSTRRRSLSAMLLFADADATAEPGSSLVWRGDNANVYGNFDPLVELRSASTGRSTEWDVEKWLRFTGETGRTGRVRYAASLTSSRLRTVKPEDVKAEVESADLTTWRTTDAGADVTKLPKPVEEK